MNGQTPTLIYLRSSRPRGNLIISLHTVSVNLIISTDIFPVNVKLTPLDFVVLYLLTFIVPRQQSLIALKIWPGFRFTYIRYRIKLSGIRAGSLLDF